MPYAPLAIAGGQALVGALNKKKPQQGVEEAAQGQTELSKTMTELGKKQYSTAAPAQQKAMSYYETLLRGNRAAQAQAVAPGVANVTDVYRGAERGLERSGVRGAARDVAGADLNRQRASQIAGLFTGIQPAAAEALGTLGTTGVGQAGAFLGGASGPLAGASATYSNLLQDQRSQEAIKRERWSKIGGGLFNLFAPFLMGKLGGGGDK